MYSRILVPVDTTYADASWLKKTLEVACDFANKSGGILHLVSVIPDNLLKGYYPDIYSNSVASDVKAKLQSIAKDMLPPDARVKLHIQTGGVCNEILRVARDINATEIVLSSHGPVLTDYLIGSNAGHIALHAPCSVFVIRQWIEAARREMTRARLEKCKVAIRSGVSTVT